MTYYAKIENGIVVNVIVADYDFISKQEGEWVETKKDGSIKGRYAGKGMKYDKNNDIFIQPQPHYSWLLDNKFEWNPPIPYPDDNNTNGINYVWNEDNKRWEKRV